MQLLILFNAENMSNIISNCFGHWSSFSLYVTLLSPFSQYILLKYLAQNLNSQLLGNKVNLNLFIYQVMFHRYRAEFNNFNLKPYSPDEWTWIWPENLPHWCTWKSLVQRHNSAYHQTSWDRAEVAPFEVNVLGRNQGLEQNKKRNSFIIAILWEIWQGLRRFHKIFVVFQFVM